ncbi:MAG TPA: glycosyltransferase family 4 protein [Solirubrobacterales bacterium]|jgi:glycosyltransferase involved in cell wall biosynthesis|nr:glycosyltransferase family 4 protein [Solirubrobacterales bacterium]
MRVLLFHGYMLRGTGSNIYNANLAPALARLGHEVHLLCQDREVELEGVRIHNPDIGGLLPVYVKDPYPGFEVKAFQELSEAELDRYLASNVAAVRAVAEEVGGIDAALANHLVMGPAILARAGIAPFAAKIHGSALEYTVKPHPRFLPYAEEGMEAANGVLVGSHHTAASLWKALPGVPGLEEKTRLGPPGVDTTHFRPSQLSRRVRLEPDGEGPRTYTSPAGSSPSGSNQPLVVFVGKLIVSKGVDLLIAAWPLVRAAHPRARLQVVGYGEYEGGVRRLLAALDRGDLQDAREVAQMGWALEGGEEKPLSILSSFLADPPPGYAEAARAAAGSVELIGRLEHDEVAALLPGAEALVMPSTFPEAFGMVAAEAAACGTLPISAGHSGMLEVSRQLSASLPERVGRLVSFPVEPGAVEAIAGRIGAWLALPEDEREAAREALVETVGQLWSWEAVARGVLAAAAGELGGLPLPE